MKRIALTMCAHFGIVFAAGAKTLTYNQHEEISLRDRSLPADEGATNVLIAVDDVASEA